MATYYKVLTYTGLESIVYSSKHHLRHRHLNGYSFSLRPVVLVVHFTSYSYVFTDLPALVNFIFVEIADYDFTVRVHIYLHLRFFINNTIRVRRNVSIKTIFNLKIENS